MYYLGIDSSTQSIKGLVIDPVAGIVAAQASVKFGEDLPQFNCPDGVLPNADPLVKQSDPLLWVAALDLVFERLRKTGLDLSQIAAIGGDGQQHGSV